MKMFSSTIYQYDREIHRTVIMDSEKFHDEISALKWAEEKKTPDNTVVVRGNFGYSTIKVL